MAMPEVLICGSLSRGGPSRSDLNYGPDRPVIDGMSKIHSIRNSCNPRETRVFRCTQVVELSTTKLGLAASGLEKINK